MQVAIDDTGRVYLATYSRVWSRAPGAGWRREPVPFGRFFAFPEQDVLSIDASSAGRAVLAWSDGSIRGRSNIRWTTFASVRRPDGTWSRRVRLSRAPATAAITDGGTVYVAWPGRLGIRIGRKPAGQPWGRPRGLVGKRGTGAPLIGASSEGKALLTYTRGYFDGSLWAAWRP
jgi:hypothetical protein